MTYVYQLKTVCSRTYSLDWTTVTSSHFVEQLMHVPDMFSDHAPHHEDGELFTAGMLETVLRNVSESYIPGQKLDQITANRPDDVSSTCALSNLRVSYLPVQVEVTLTLQNLHSKQCNSPLISTKNPHCMNCCKLNIRSVSFGTSCYVLVTLTYPERFKFLFHDISPHLPACVVSDPLEMNHVPATVNQLLL
jgi:hypothetical protein